MTGKQWIIGGSLLALLCAVAVVVVLIAGGGEDSSSAAPPGEPGAPFGQASQELQDCLAEQGVEPGSGPPIGAPDGDMQRAFEDCREFMPDPPEGGLPAPPGGGGFPPSSG